MSRSMQGGYVEPIQLKEEKSESDLKSAPKSLMHSNSAAQNANAQAVEAEALTVISRPFPVDEKEEWLLPTEPYQQWPERKNDGKKMEPSLAHIVKKLFFGTEKEAKKYLRGQKSEWFQSQEAIYLFKVAIRQRPSLLNIFFFKGCVLEPNASEREDLLSVAVTYYTDFDDAQLESKDPILIETLLEGGKYSWTPAQLAQALLLSIKKPGKNYGALHALCNHVQKSPQISEIVHELSKRNLGNAYNKSRDYMRNSILKAPFLSPTAALHFLYASCTPFPGKMDYFREVFPWWCEKYTRYHPNYKGFLLDEPIDNLGNTFLMYVACHEPRMDALISALAEQKINFSKKNKEGKNALEIVTGQGKHRAVQQLLDCFHWDATEIERALAIAKKLPPQKNCKQLKQLFFSYALKRNIEPLIKKMAREEAREIGKWYAFGFMGCNTATIKAVKEAKILDLEGEYTEGRTPLQQVVWEFKEHQDKKACLQKVGWLIDQGVDIKAAFEKMLKKAEEECKDSTDVSQSKSFEQAKYLLILASECLYATKEVNKALTLEEVDEMSTDKQPIQNLRKAFANLFSPPLPDLPRFAAPLAAARPAPFLAYAVKSPNASQSALPPQL